MERAIGSCGCAVRLSWVQDVRKENKYIIYSVLQSNFAWAKCKTLPDCANVIPYEISTTYLWRHGPVLKFPLNCTPKNLLLLSSAVSKVAFFSQAAVSTASFRVRNLSPNLLPIFIMFSLNWHNLNLLPLSKRQVNSSTNVPAAQHAWTPLAHLATVPTEHMGSEQQLFASFRIKLKRIAKIFKDWKKFRGQ